jgi:hypothetical protein
VRACVHARVRAIAPRARAPWVATEATRRELSLYTTRESPLGPHTLDYTTRESPLGRHTPALPPSSLTCAFHSMLRAGAACARWNSLCVPLLDWGHSLAPHRPAAQSLTGAAVLAPSHLPPACACSIGVCMGYPWQESFPESYPGRKAPAKDTPYACACSLGAWRCCLFVGVFGGAPRLGAPKRVSRALVDREFACAVRLVFVPCAVRAVPATGDSCTWWSLSRTGEQSSAWWTTAEASSKQAEKQ